MTNISVIRGEFVQGAWTSPALGVHMDAEHVEALGNVAQPSTADGLEKLIADANRAGRLMVAAELLSIVMPQDEVADVAAESVLFAHSDMEPPSSSRPGAITGLFSSEWTRHAVHGQPFPGIQTGVAVVALANQIRTFLLSPSSEPAEEDSDAVVYARAVDVNPEPGKQIAAAMNSGGNANRLGLVVSGVKYYGQERKQLNTISMSIALDGTRQRLASADFWMRTRNGALDIGVNSGSKHVRIRHGMIQVHTTAGSRLPDAAITAMAQALWVQNQTSAEQ